MDHFGNYYVALTKNDATFLPFEAFEPSLSLSNINMRSHECLMGKDLRNLSINDKSQKTD